MDRLEYLEQQLKEYNLFKTSVRFLCAELPKTLANQKAIRKHENRTNSI
jgi:hypothetical protein